VPRPFPRKLILFSAAVLVLCAAPGIFAPQTLTQSATAKATVDAAKAAG